MTVTYRKAQREKAKVEGLRLITVSVPGLEFQGPVSKEDANSLLAWLTAFLGRRRGHLPPCTAVADSSKETT